MESPTETENLVLSPYSNKQASKLPSLLKKTGKRYRVNLIQVLILLSIPVSSYRTLKLLSFLPAPWPIGAGWLRHSSGPTTLSALPGSDAPCKKAYRTWH